MKTGVTAKSALHIVTWLLVVTFAVNIVALLSPSRVLVRTVVESYVVDHDIVYSVPRHALSERAGDGKLRKVCVYWGGGTYLSPIFAAVDEKCGLFRQKQGSARLIDW